MTHLADALRLASTLACGAVLVAFMLWATDEGRAASADQAAQIDTPAAPGVTPVAAAQPPEHDGLRGAIEDVNATLIAPFEGVTSSTNEWVQHGVPMLLALLAYGLLARLLIAYLPAR